MVQELDMPASVVITPTPIYSPQRSNEIIVGANCCQNFLYNIPRGSVMVTLPGVIILVIGGILVAVTNRDEGWWDSNALICFIFLVLGGAWTIGALMFWIIVWCRYRPVVPSKKKSQPKSGIELTLTPESPNGLELMSVQPYVHRYPSGDNPSFAESSQTVATDVDSSPKVFTVD